MIPVEQLRQAIGRNAALDRLINWRLDWIEKARPKQLPPPGDWRSWLVMAGRGFGKTRIGAETLGFWAASRPSTRWAAIGSTQSDVRSVMFEGESGLLAVIPEQFRPGSSYRSTDLELDVRVGDVRALIVGKSAEKPDRLRGPQWHGGWGDEIAAWGASNGTGKKAEAKRLKETWDNYVFGLRLGTDPRTIITTTPRPLPFIRALIANPRVHTTRGNTFENSANLADSALETFREVYEGTSLGRQELYGEVLTDNARALWKTAMLDAGRRKPSDTLPTMRRIVVSIDPNTVDSPDSDEAGIIVAGLGDDGKAYVLADLSGQHSTTQWAQTALAAYERWQADAIIAEVNNGGDLVENNIRALANGQPVKVKTVRAKRGKYLRAEPIAALYEKGRVHHVGQFARLEAQMTEFVGAEGGASPDRLDALVYAVGELVLGVRAHAVY